MERAKYSTLKCIKIYHVRQIAKVCDLFPWLMIIRASYESWFLKL